MNAVSTSLSFKIDGLWLDGNEITTISNGELDHKDIQSTLKNDNTSDQPRIMGGEGEDD